MKRVFAVLFCAFMLNGCDDGDLISENIDFADVAMARCSENNSNILYKLNGKEALLLQIPNLDTELPDAPTAEGSPHTIEINNTTVRLVYRVYSGDATVNNICASIQPPTPVITEEWNALSGTVEITTTTVKEANTAAGFEGGEKITKKRHAIVVRNVTFQTPNNQIVYETFPFGNYEEAFTGPALNLGTEVARCPSNLVYKIFGNKALTINIDPTLLDTSVLNTPKTGIIAGELNKVTYNVFSADVDLAALTDFCSQYPGLTPVESWYGVDGVAGVSGIVEVTTTTFGSGSFTHSIHLKNVTLQRADGLFSFKIADDFLYAELIE